MRKWGFSAPFAGAVTAASAVVGPIFPPGIPLIVYGSVTSVSIVQLLLAGVVPALICIVLLMITATSLAIVHKMPRAERAPTLSALRSSGQGAAFVSPRSSGMRQGDKRPASQPISGQERHRHRPADRSPTPALRRVLVQVDPVSGAMVEHATHADEVGAAGLIVISHVLSRGTPALAQRHHFEAILSAALELPARDLQQPLLRL